MIPGQATAEAADAASFSISSGVPRIRFVRPANPGEVVINRGFDHRRGHIPDRGDWGSDGRHGRHIRVNDDGVDGAVLAGGGWGYGSGYNDYGDYDANRSFSPDKWNDWWHERPERAFPRWMSRNKDCARRWYSGDTLTC
jgi:hypothetical protein